MQPHIPRGKKAPWPPARIDRTRLPAQISGMSDTATPPGNGLDEALLERVVREFYGTARQDPLLGPVFARVTDWEHHIAQISAFWSSVALRTGRYQGNPMGAHLPLALTPAHFARWLELWEATTGALCPPEGAALLLDRAHRIADSLQHALAVRNGELPPLRVRPRTPAGAGGPA